MGLHDAEMMMMNTTLSERVFLFRAPKTQTHTNTHTRHHPRSSLPPQQFHDDGDDAIKMVRRVDDSGICR